MGCRAATLILILALAGCATDRRPPRPPLHLAAASIAVTVGRSLVDLAEFVVWRAPELIVIKLPRWLFYDGPRALLLSMSSRRTRVGALVESLSGPISEEDRLAAVTNLREMTGLPLGDAAAWEAWWEKARDRDEAAWLGDFADACIADLSSEDFLVRQVADERLRALSGKDVGYDAKEDEEYREEAVGRWRAWRRELGGTEGGRD